MKLAIASAALLTTMGYSALLRMMMADDSQLGRRRRRRRRRLDDATAPQKKNAFSQKVNPYDNDNDEPAENTIETTTTTTLGGISPDLDLDLGILSRDATLPGSGSRRNLAAPCPGSSFECVDGYVPNANPPRSCATECIVAGQVRCCSGLKACDNFTGFLCKDDTSCFGDYSCYYANIRSIVKGCNGDRSCIYAANGNGYVGEVNNGCIGKYSCLEIAEYEGSIAKIIDSCLGDDACGYAAQGVNTITYNGGQIEEIRSSCNGTYACYGAAYNGGKIGPIVESCNGIRACGYVAACNNESGGCTSSIVEITKSCIDYEACYSASYDNGTIGTMSSSCRGSRSCYELAFRGGGVAGARGACNAQRACYRGGRFAAGSVSTVLDERCCNFASACEYVTGANATMLCQAAAPSPTRSPSRSPTKRPTFFPTAKPSPSPTPPPSSSGGSNPGTKSSKKAKKQSKTTKAAKNVKAKYLTQASNTILNAEAAAADDNEKNNDSTVSVKRYREHHASDNNA